MKTTVFAILLFCACTIATAQNKYFEIFTDSTALKTENDRLIEHIESRVQLIKPSFSFNGLTTEVPNTFMPGQYLQKTNKIYLNTWQVGGPPMEAFLTEMAGGKDEGIRMGGLFFYGFFLPHEIGHAMQYTTSNVPENRYDAEYEANEFAVSYWKKQGRDTELQQCYDMALAALKKLKNPVPEGQSMKQYFNDNYHELIKDPNKYGYFQLLQIVQVMDDKSLPDFYSYIRKYVGESDEGKRKG